MKKVLNLLLLACLSLNFTSNINSDLGIGDIAPDFSLKNVDGNIVSLSDFKNVKGYIVVFTSNTCPYSIANEERLIELSKKYKTDFPVIAINPNDADVKPEESLEKMKERAQSKKFDFVYLKDENQTIYPAYGVTKTLQVYLLDKNREVKYTGAIDDSAHDASGVKTKYIEDAIADVLAGRDVKLAVTKAVGCGIKIKKLD